MDHRGRFQAQGKKLEESEAWAQESPLNIVVGRAKLETLKTKLDEKDRKLRLPAFVECRSFIDRANRNGGINVGAMGKPLLKSFPKNQVERVDLEVQRGIAFIT